MMFRRFSCLGLTRNAYVEKESSGKNRRKYAHEPIASHFGGFRRLSRSDSDHCQRRNARQKQQPSVLLACAPPLGCRFLSHDNTQSTITLDCWSSGGRNCLILMPQARQVCLVKNRHSPSRSRRIDRYREFPAKRAPSHEPG